jgi:hypothetical protein
MPQNGAKYVMMGTWAQIDVWNTSPWTKMFFTNHVSMNFHFSYFYQNCHHLSFFLFIFFKHLIFLVCKLLLPLAHYILGGYFLSSLPFVLNLLSNVLKFSWLTLCTKGSSHYYKMRLSSLWVSLDFEWIWTFLLGEIVQTPSEH